MRAPEPPLVPAAALALALVLTVVLAAAAIRLGTGFPAVRIVHRVAASLEVMVVLWLVWMAPRSRAAWLAVALSAGLSVVGIAAGQSPPPAAAAANLLGGLALVAVLSWMLGAHRTGNRALTPIWLLVAAQLALGAWLALVDRFGPAVPAHALLAIALAAVLAWFGLARVPGAAGKLLFAAALAAPLGGFTALHYEHSAAAALVHAAMAALLLLTAAYAFGRAGLTHIKGTACARGQSPGHG